MSFKNSRMKVAIIGGTGKMGRWFAEFLKQDGKEVIITGRNEKKRLDTQRELGVQAGSNIEAIKAADVAVISLPIDSLEAVAQEIAPHVRPEQIIIDVTSVKVQPQAFLHHHLNTRLVLGVHPMFGPGARNIRGQNFILTPTSAPENTLAQKVKDYLTERDARVTLMTPEEHDRMMTVILGLSHFIAIVTADTLLDTTRLGETRAISSTTYKALLTLVGSVISEDPKLYSTLQMNFPDITGVENAFLEKTGAWAKLVRDKNQTEFVKRMQELKKRFEDNDPDFQNAYRQMYQIAGNPEFTP